MADYVDPIFGVTWPHIEPDYEVSVSFDLIFSEILNKIKEKGEEPTVPDWLEGIERLRYANLTDIIESVHMPNFSKALNMSLDKIYIENGESGHRLMVMLNTAYLTKSNYDDDEIAVLEALNRREVAMISDLQVSDIFKLKLVMVMHSLLNMHDYLMSIFTMIDSELDLDIRTIIDIIGRSCNRLPFREIYYIAIIGNVSDKIKDTLHYIMNSGLSENDIKTVIAYTNACCIQNGIEFNLFKYLAETVDINSKPRLYAILKDSSIIS